MGILGFFFWVNSAQASSRFYSLLFYSVWLMMLLFSGLLPFGVELRASLAMLLLP